MIHLSASGLARAGKCPASASLPRIGQLHADAERGTAEHAALEVGTTNREIAFAWNPVLGAARHLGQGLARNYPVDWNSEIPGTLDQLDVEADRVVVSDDKTGFGYMVAPAKVNLQLAHNAICAADVHKKDAARVVIRRTATGHEDVADLDAFDLIAARNRIGAIWTEANKPDPRVVTGDHCWRCECIQHCPAHLMLAVAFTEGIWGDVIPSDGLTPQRIAQGWEYLKTAKRLLGVVEKTYRAVASQGPIPLANGNVLGPREKEREELDGPVAFQVLRDMHGEKVARAAVGMETSKSALEEALREIAPPRGRAKLVREALAAIAAANGVVVKRGVSIEEYKPEEQQNV